METQQAQLDQHNNDSEQDDSDHASFTRPRGHSQQNQRSVTDFKIDIPEFEGKLDPDKFLD